MFVFSVYDDDFVMFGVYWVRLNLISWLVGYRVNKEKIGFFFWLMIILDYDMVIMGIVI